MTQRILIIGGGFSGMSAAIELRKQGHSVDLVELDAGWRNYHFVKISTEDGVVGWSEYDEGFGAPGVGTAI